MRRELFINICDALNSIEGNPIKHIDMWNQNVEFIEQEQPWDMPAVFVEFAPIAWQQQQNRSYRAEVIVRLHVVTRWEGSAAAGSSYQGEALQVFDLLQSILAALTDLPGHSYHNMRRITSITNHNHEDILESIEEYKCIAVDNSVAV